MSKTKVYDSESLMKYVEYALEYIYINNTNIRASVQRKATMIEKDIIKNIIFGGVYTFNCLICSTSKKDILQHMQIILNCTENISVSIFRDFVGLEKGAHVDTYKTIYQPLENLIENLWKDIIE